MPIIKATKVTNLKAMLRFPFNLEFKLDLILLLSPKDYPVPLKKKKKNPPNKEDRVKLSKLCCMTPVR